MLRPGCTAATGCVAANQLLRINLGALLRINLLRIHLVCAAAINLGALPQGESTWVRCQPGCAADWVRCRKSIWVRCRSGCAAVAGESIWCAAAKSTWVRCRPGCAADRCAADRCAADRVRCRPGCAAAGRINLGALPQVRCRNLGALPAATWVLCRPGCAAAGWLPYHLGALLLGALLHPWVRRSGSDGGEDGGGSDGYEVAHGWFAVFVEGQSSAVVV
jgi:hypothetical protein